MSSVRSFGARPVRVIAAAIGIIAVAFIVLLATRDTQQNGPNFDVIGEQAPAVVGVSYQGESFDLDEVLATNRTLACEDQTWVVVNFFASWCTGCVTEHPELMRFVDEGISNDEGVACPTALVGVTFNDTEADVIDFFERLGGDWSVLVGDSTNQIAIDYSVLTAPETVVIAPSGLVVDKLIAAVTYEDLAARITC